MTARLLELPTEGGCTPIACPLREGLGLMAGSIAPIWANPPIYPSITSPQLPATSLGASPNRH
jgi:hypothetical protein